MIEAKSEEIENLLREKETPLIKKKMFEMKNKLALNFSV